MTRPDLEEGQPLGEEMALIPFHFDMPDHSLPLNQFIDTAKSTQAIIDNFNKEFFENKVKYKIHVLTPKEGGLIEILGIGVAGYVAKKFWEFLESDIGKAYIKGLTGEEPVHWAEKAGKKTNEFLSDESGGSLEIVKQGDKAKPQTPTKEEKKAVSIIVVQITLGFLQKEPEELRKLGLSKEKFRAAYHARNKIYQECIDNREVKGLGFDTTHNFCIKRNEFPKYIVDVPYDEEEKEENKEDHKWVVDTLHITVNSPNWKRDGRKWLADTNKHKDIAFSLEDEDFWGHVEIKDIQPNIKDNMKVQWAYQEGSGKPTGVRVLRVLSYNGTKISGRLTDEQIKQELLEYSVEERAQTEFPFDEYTENDSDETSQQDSEER